MAKNSSVCSDRRALEIEKIVKEVFSKQKFKSFFPIDIEAIIRFYGFQIVELSKPNIGLLIVNNQDFIIDNFHRAIGFSNNFSIRETRFVVSYMFGYYMLHPNDSRFAQREKMKKRNGVIELRYEDAEAARFARAFLMPSNFMKSAIKVYKENPELIEKYGSIVNFISETFEVTTRNAEIRIMEVSMQEN